MDYIKYDFPFPIHVHHIQGSGEIKGELLELIGKQTSSNVKITCSISRTDWFTDIGEEREYFKLLRKHIDIPIKQILTDTQPEGDCGFKYENVWFQQYRKGDYHTFHNHGSLWSGVYFVELPDETLTTEFFVPYSRETVRFEVREGDLLTFPGTLFHRSPVNGSIARKTIIAFNLLSYY